VTVEALKGISFDVRKGEIRGFIGPNGAGKSTTIKILSGILYPTAGSVTVNGLRPWDDREKYVKTIGVVFGQKQQLWLDLPAMDTFYLNRAMYDIPKARFEKTLKYLVSLFEIDEIAKRPARQLSLGEKMKCELVSNLLHEPDIVFLDEPTIGLDILSKERIRAYIRKVNKDKGTTFLLTTHDLDDIENLCENVLVINKGNIVYDGKLKDLGTDVKILDIKLKDRKDIPLLPRGMRVLSSEGDSLKVEVNIGEIEIGEAVSHIVRNIKDINISNPEIESVVKRLYE